MPAKYFLIFRNYVLSVSSQRKYNFYHQNILLDAFRTNSRNIIGRNPSMVIPLLANQDLTPMLYKARKISHISDLPPSRQSKSEARTGLTSASPFAIRGVSCAQELRERNVPLHYFANVTTNFRYWRYAFSTKC